LGERKLQTSLRHCCIQTSLVIGLTLFIPIATGGCGMSVDGVPTLGSSLNTVLDDAGASRSAASLIVLNWDGGANMLYPNLDLQPLDLALLATEDGGSLADREQEFKEQVRSRIEQILGGVEGVNVRIVSSDQNRDPAVETTVHLSQEMSPTGNVEIGRADYDPCNEHYGDEAVIFGEQIRRLGNGYTFEEWVTLFANVCSHETLHTFGYGHVLRSEHPPTDRAIYVELMLDNHTMNEMCRPQRLIHELSSCPTGDGAPKTLADDSGGVPMTVRRACKHNR